MKSRWLGLVQVLGAGFAVHALMAACSGGAASPAVAHADGTTGGSAGGTGACSCPEPDVRTVTCAADAGAGIIEADYPGKTAAQLARAVVIGHAAPPNTGFEWIQPSFLDDGKVLFTCSGQQFDTAQIILPP